MRTRLRPAYDAKELVSIYSGGYRHEIWPDHRLRVSASQTIVSWAFQEFNLHSIGDLSAGDGAIARACLADHMTLGDLAYDNVKRYFDADVTLHGPLEETVTQMGNVDLYVCSETLEHLDDPDSFLSTISFKTKFLFVSTPIGENAGIGNHEHYWGWGTSDVDQMLRDAGFEPVVYSEVQFREERFPYDYQMWLVRHV